MGGGRLREVVAHGGSTVMLRNFDIFKILTLKSVFKFGGHSALGGRKAQ